MADKKLIEAPDTSFSAAVKALDTSVDAPNSQLLKAQSRMDRVAEAVTAVALTQIAQAAGG